jgi:5'(3')-deoxyribonucleotidase
MIKLVFNIEMTMVLERGVINLEMQNFVTCGNKNTMETHYYLCNPQAQQNENFV